MGEELGYRSRTAASAREHERSRRLIPGGVSSPIQYTAPYPLCVAKGEGARLWDVDGNEYVDFLLAFGAAAAGHAHPVIVEAIREQAGQGTLFCLPTRLAADLAEEIQRRYPCIDMLRYTQSGMEATLHAVRLARAATGRERIIKIEGAYHGHADPLLVSIGDAPLEAMGDAAAPASTPDSDGLLPAVTARTVAVQFNDLAGMEAAFERHDGDIAAVIIEPLMTGAGIVPPADGYLQGVRDLTTRHGAVLIFDEVQIGCRIAEGGAVERYGVTPDLVTLAKVIGGGTPVGAFGGRRDLMELLAPLGRTGHAGTYSGNPLGMAAGLACLTRVLTPEAYAEMERLAAMLAEGQRKIVEAHAYPVTVTQAGPLGGILFHAGPPSNYREAARADAGRWREYWFGMLEQGVIPMGPAWFKVWSVSVAHNEADIEQALEATEGVLAPMYGV